MATAQHACANLASSITAATARALEELSSTGSVKTSTLGSLIGVIKSTCSLLNLSSVKEVDRLARKWFMHESVREAWEDMAQAIRGNCCWQFQGSLPFFFSHLLRACVKCAAVCLTACCAAAWDKLVAHVDLLSRDSSHYIPSPQLALPADSILSDANPLLKKQRVVYEESRDSAAASADAIPARSILTLPLTDVTTCEQSPLHSSSLPTIPPPLFLSPPCAFASAISLIQFELFSCCLLQRHPLVPLPNSRLQPRVAYSHATHRLITVTSAREGRLIYLGV